MGIDKPDVRFVFHHSLPDRLDEYYQVRKVSYRCPTVPELTRLVVQETGRAGRDGAPSTCVLFYREKDTHTPKHSITLESSSTELQRRKRALYDSVVEYCTNRSECRRSKLLRYLGEKLSPNACDRACDICLSPASGNVQLQDVTDLARQALRLVIELQDRGNFTMLDVVSIFRGTSNTKVRSRSRAKAHFGS